MEKKRQLNIWGIFIVVIIVVTFCNPVYGADKVYKWRMQSLLPASMIELEQVYADMVNKMSNGRIEIKMFSDGEIVPFPEMLSATSKNVIQMCNTIASAHDDLKMGSFYCDAPYAWSTFADLLSLFYTFKDGQLMKIANAECEKNGVHLLGPAFADPASILSTKPLKEISDVKGFKCQTMGFAHGDLLKQLGGVGNFIPPEELYLALSSGIVEGAIFGGAFTYEAMGLIEVAKYYNVPSMTFPVASTYLINLETWKSLPEGLQLILETALTKYGNDNVAFFNTKEYEARKNIEDKGGKIVQMSPELVDYMEQAAYRTWEVLAEKGPSAREACDILKEWNALRNK